jgi:MFS family permease
VTTSTEATRLAHAIVADDSVRARLQKRTLTVVVISQVLGGAGLAAGVTVGALLAQELLESDGLAGMPTALFTLGAALAAFLVGRFSQRIGRRLGLGLGFAAGGIGAIGVVVAATLGSIPMFFLFLFVYGAGTATNLQARYAGADLALPTRRGTAISVAMVSTTIGAVAGPNLVGPMGVFAEGFGIPALAGPFMLAAAAYIAAGTVLMLLLRPDPLLVAREVAAIRDDQHKATTSAAKPRPGRGAYFGATVMVLTQISMVAIMTMTPVHMRAHDHDLGDIGLVIGLHIAAMYLPSLATGALVDRIGRTPMAIAAGVTLLSAGVAGALAPGESLGWLIFALVLLGLGWNFGLIAGTALVVDGTVPANRASTQGAIDVLVALAGASGGALSGLVMAGTSFELLALAGGILSLLLIPVLIWAVRGRKANGAMAR